MPTFEKGLDIYSLMPKPSFLKKEVFDEEEDEIHIEKLRVFVLIPNDFADIFISLFYLVKCFV